MPTPLKHPSVRARRNKASTHAILTPQTAADIPDLPEREESWTRHTLAWWRDVWASPMAPEYDDSDRHGLFMLAVLVDLFWTKPHWTTAAEIRLQAQRFGLSPLDRRRLQWEIERTDEAQDRGARRRQATKTPAQTGADPRDVLRAV